MATEKIELQDGVSGPANAAAGAVSGLGRAIDAVKKAAGSSAGLDRAFEQLRAAAGRADSQVKRLQDDIKRLQNEAKKPIALEVTGGRGGGLDKALDSLGKGGGLGGIASAGGIGAGIGIALKGAELVLDVVKAIAKEMADLTIKGAELAIEMSNWQTTTRAMLTNLTGSHAGADKLLEQAKGISRLTGESQESVVGRMQKLIADGFSPKATDKILRAVADVSAARGSAAGEKLQSAIEAVKNKDVATAGDFKKLARAGVNVGDVYAELSRRTHRSLDQVKADLKAGRIEGDLAAAAIASAAEKRYGGAAKAKGDNDIFILLARIKEGFKDLFKGVDLGPVRGALQNLDKVLQGAGGAKLKGSISGFFGQLFHTLLDPFNGADGKKRMEEFAKAGAQGLDKLTGLLKAAAPYVQLLVLGMTELGRKDAKGLTGFDRLLGTINRVWEILKLITGFSKDPFKSIKEILGETEKTKAPKTGVDKVAEVANAFGQGAGADAAGLADDQKAPFGAVGDAMVDGIADAVNAGKSRVVEACRAMAAEGAAGARSELAIASPSRVFAKIGMYAVDGLATGLSANDRVSAAASAAASTTASAAALATPGAAGGGGAPVTQYFSLNHQTNIDGAGQDAAQTADAMRGSMENTHRDAMTRWAREMREAAA